jgi:hypothetical protein
MPTWLDRLLPKRDRRIPTVWPNLSQQARTPPLQYVMRVQTLADRVAAAATYAAEQTRWGRGYR